MEDEAFLNNEEAENETLTFEQWIEQGNEEFQEEAPLQEQIIVERRDSGAVERL